jgi:hypothetical protein
MQVLEYPAWRRLYLVTTLGVQIALARGRFRARESQAEVRTIQHASLHGLFLVSVYPQRQSIAPRGADPDSDRGIIAPKKGGQRQVP